VKAAIFLKVSVILTEKSVRLKEMKVVSMITPSRLFAPLMSSQTCATSSLVLTLQSTTAERQTLINFQLSSVSIMDLDQDALQEKLQLEVHSRVTSATNLFVKETPSKSQ